jgi:hypothetical protein
VCSSDLAAALDWPAPLPAGPGPRGPRHAPSLAHPHPHHPPLATRAAAGPLPGPFQYFTPPPKPKKKAAGAAGGGSLRPAAPPASKKKKKGKGKAAALLPALKVDYRGVTRHRRSGRFEAHLWLKCYGRQAFLGGWSSGGAAAAAIDLVALKSFFDAGHAWPALAAAIQGAGGAGGCVCEAGLDPAAAAATATAAIAAVPSLNLPPQAFVPCLPALAATTLDALVTDLRAQSKSARGPADGPRLGRVAWAQLAAAAGLGLDGEEEDGEGADGAAAEAAVAVVVPPVAFDGPGDRGAPLHLHRLSDPAGGGGVGGGGGGGGGLVLPHKARAKRSLSW